MALTQAIKRDFGKLSRAVAAAVAMAALPAPLRSASITWDNGGNNFEWSTASNWSGNVQPTINDTLTFPAAVPDDIATILLSSGELAQSLIFNNNYDLTGGSLELSFVEPHHITTAAGTSVFIDSTLKGGSITKLGSGTLTLLGTNTFIGTLVISGGTVAINSDAALGHANSGISFADTTLATSASFSTSRSWLTSGIATINVASATTLTHTGSIGGISSLIRKAGAGTLALALSEFQADLRINIQEGTVRLAANNGAGPAVGVTGSAGGTLDLAGFNQVVNFDGDMSVINSGGAPSTLTTDGFSDFGGTISGNIALVHVGGGNMFLRLSNGYTGGTTVNGGAVVIAADNRLGVAGTTLMLNNGILHATETFTLPRPMVTSAAGFGFNVDAGKTLTITGNVTGGGDLIKIGAGTLVLTGASARADGATTVTAGTVVLQQPSPGILAAPGNVTIGDGTGTDTLQLLQFEQIADAADVTIATSGVLALGTFTETIANLTMTGGQVSGSGATLKLSEDVTIDASAAGASIAPQLDLGNLAHLFAVADGAADADLSVSGRIVSGDLVKSGAGRMDVWRFRDFGALTILAGTVRLLDDDGTVGVSDIASLARGASAKLDVRDNKLIVTSDGIGSWNGSAYTGVTGMIDSGRGASANAQWNGGGIVTSDPRAVSTNDLCSIGVATASQVKGIAATGTVLWAGETVLGSDVLVMFTWGGDATLDGKINIDDYGRIDGNVAASGSVFGWFNGDFNYDGKINIDDYGIIDGNINRQGAAFSTGGGIENTTADFGELSRAVPEPGGVLLMSLGVISRGRRTRRRG